MLCPSTNYYRRLSQPINLSDTADSKHGVPGH